MTILASTSIRRSKKTTRNWTPAIFMIAVLAFVVWRMLFLSSEHGFDAAHFANAALASLRVGSLYALIALGYTMVYGIIRLINFAHGEVFMIGAFVAYFLFSATPYPWPLAIFLAILIAYGVMRMLDFFRGSMRDKWVLIGGASCFVIFTIALATVQINWIVAMLLSMIITGVIGILIDRIAYVPLRGAPRNSMLITAIAVSFFLQNAGILIFTTNQTPFRPDTVLTNRFSIDFFGGTLSSTYIMLFIPVLTAVLVIALNAFVNKTRLGKAMRATAQDPEVAEMMGVNVTRVIATTFLLGSALAAAAGVMWGLTFGSLNQPSVFGVLPGIKAFAAAVIGGIGSLPGAVIGGVLLGFLENFLTALFPRVPGFAGITEYRDTFAFAALIIILLIRPSGIIGEDLSEKV